ncbi:spindle pole body component, putative [Talaromyces stipitatus ATCC 10500]|uniref:Spindle pole body component, putative n=1 Tax=Talaromyces stipitatus (strain ATCC 10500 / CBS 375.48 / QM 6759 / NRRL 1006) TaxID=441959 RepID=B8MAL0_TALSN|nr:spindle pole body component, putative [Talaromyces stipitatus ATCC 10500]EED17434.1 spindle pole body component, putative [Talaromyces stipitatus ATCC 10500]
MADAEEDYSSLPLPDRFTHKVWKARKGGYEDAAKQFEKTPDESDPVFAPFLQDPSLWKGAVADSNVAAQQEGLAAYCAFLKYGGVQACTRSRGATVSAIAEKALPSARPAAKANALEALLLLIELDKADPVIEDLLPILSAKQPKSVAAGLNAITAIYHNYGCKIVDPKPVLKILPKVFGHADKNVRAEAQNLTVELYRWLKEAMKPVFWGELKPVQQQDLDKLFEKAKEEAPPKQERLTRAQQEAMASAPAAGEDDAGGEAGEDYGEDDGEMEPLDLAEPVDVMPKVPKNLHEQLSSTKWKDRKESLDELYNALNVPRIQEAPFDEIVKALAKCMKDANIAVVTVAANCVDLLAKGLRSGFAKYRSIIMSPIMERLKEKKQSVADALGQALDAVFASTGLSECLEEIFEFLKHKNPQVKQETVKFLVRCLRTTRDVPSKPEVKSIAEAAIKLLTESSEVVRSGAAEILGTLMKIMGERAMNPYLDGLDDIRKAKIKEYFDTAEVKAKDRPKPIIAPPKPAVPAAKKAAPGSKKPALGLKKSAPAAAPPPPVEEPSPPPKPKAVPKSGLARPGGVPKSGLATPGGGLKMQRRIPGVGGAAAGSPRRVSSPPPDEPAPAPPPAQPKFGLGRGLTGRPISKTAAPAEAAPVAAPVMSGLAAVERAELEELRLEKERLLKINEDLKSEKTRLSSQVTELQNQNAQLIEDHTRDVLSIKAKETQLVRARSDAETAEQTVQKQQREIDRLKRELTRAVRASAVSPPAVLSDGLHAGVSDNGPLSPETGTYSSNGSRAGHYMGSRLDNRPRSYISSPSEDKENNGFGSPTAETHLDSTFGRRKFSPPVGQSLSSRGSPVRATSRYASASSNHSGEDQPSITSRSAEPAENWKRAAEVTSQLKARIEQMKARQGLTRPPPSAHS